MLCGHGVEEICLHIVESDSLCCVLHSNNENWRRALSRVRAE